MGYLIGLLWENTDINMIHDAALAVTQASEQRVLVLKNAIAKHASRLDLAKRTRTTSVPQGDYCIQNEITSLTSRSGFSYAPGYCNVCYMMCSSECVCWESVCVATAVCTGSVKHITTGSFAAICSNFYI